MTAPISNFVLRPVLASVLVAAAGTSLAAEKEGTMRPIVIAHRGASGYLPEHTLAAKSMAFAMGADYLEQDLVLSRDGVPVVLHDIQIDTVTDVARRFPDRRREDGRFYALDFTLAELKQLAVTERVDAKTGAAVYAKRFPPGRSSFSVATLEEELELIEGLIRSTGRPVGIYPEIKQPAWHRRQGQDISAVVLPILARHGYRTKADRCYVQCFEFAELERIRNELKFEGRLIFLFGKDPPPDLERVRRVADGIGPALGAVVAARTNGPPEITPLVRQAHALGLEVHPYTARADDLPPYAASFDALLDLLLVQAGADGLFTDFPDRAAAFVRARAWPLRPKP